MKIALGEFLSICAIQLKRFVAHTYTHTHMHTHSCKQTLIYSRSFDLSQVNGAGDRSVIFIVKKQWFSRKQICFNPAYSTFAICYCNTIMRKSPKWLLQTIIRPNGGKR